MPEWDKHDWFMDLNDLDDIKWWEWLLIIGIALLPSLIFIGIMYYLMWIKYPPSSFGV